MSARGVVLAGSVREDLDGSVRAVAFAGSDLGGIGWAGVA